MAFDITEADWKVYSKTLFPVALDRFCERVLDEIQRIASDPSRSPHERYVAIYKHARERDKKLAALFDEFRRSSALLQLMLMRANGLLTDEELAPLSPEARERTQPFRYSCESDASAEGTNEPA